MANLQDYLDSFDALESDWETEQRIAQQWSHFDPAFVDGKLIEVSLMPMLDAQREFLDATTLREAVERAEAKRAQDTINDGIRRYQQAYFQRGAMPVGLLNLRPVEKSANAHFGRMWQMGLLAFSAGVIVGTLLDAIIHWGLLR